MCLYIYIHNVGCTVQCRSKLCKEKNIFKSVQYLNKEYSIYYPGVLDDCDKNTNLQLVLDLNTIWHTGGLNNTLQRRFPRWCRLNASSPLFYHQGIFTFSTQWVVQAKKTKQITPCTFFRVCVLPHSSDIWRVTINRQVWHLQADNVFSQTKQSLVLNLISHPDTAKTNYWYVIW